MNKMVKVTTEPGTVMYSGNSKLWRPANRRVGVEMLLYPNRHVGRAELMLPLLAWCRVPANRPAIGTEVGQRAFADSVAPPMNPR